MKTTGRAYIREVPDQLGHLIDFIQKKYPRPDQLPERLSERIRRFRRSVSAEPLSYSFRWVFDTAVFRQSIRQFNNNFTAIQYHEKPTVTKYLIKYEQNSPVPTISRDQSAVPTSSDTRAPAFFIATETFIKFTSAGIMGKRFSNAKRAELRQMMKKVFANVGIQPGPPGPPGPAGTPGRNRTTVVTTGDVNSTRWNPSEMGFFDPMYDNKSVNTGSAIEHVGKNIYFRDVQFFIERVKKISLIKPVDFVRVNLWMNFRGTAFEWWTSFTMHSNWNYDVTSAVPTMFQFSARILQT